MRQMVKRTLMIFHAIECLIDSWPKEGEFHYPPQNKRSHLFRGLLGGFLKYFWLKPS